MRGQEGGLQAVLAQFDVFEGANVAPLPPSPVIERVLLDNPWPAVVMFALVGLVGFVVLNGRGKGRQGLVMGLAGLVLAAAAYGVGWVVSTPREQIKQGTRELIDATAGVDIGALDALLDEDVEVFVTRVGRGADKDQIIEAVERYLGSTYRVREWSILDLQATLDGPRLGRTQVRVRVTGELGVLPSWWRIDWLRQPDGSWVVRRIEALWIPGVPNPGG